MGKYNFKKAIRFNQKRDDRISIFKSNSFGFLIGFVKSNNITDFKYVVLYYDEINKVIGFLFTKERSQGCFKIIHSKKKYGSVIFAHSFFKEFKLDPEKYHGRYEWKNVKQEGIGNLYIIQLLKEK